MNISKLMRATRGEIVKLLRDRPLTAGEIAAELGLNVNGVRAHLTALEAQGIVEQKTPRKAYRKPQHVYALSEQAQRTYVLAHEPVLAAVAGVIAQLLPQGELDRVFTQAGENLAATIGYRGATLDERVAATQEVLGELGAVTTVAEHPEGLILRGAKCPLESVVGKCPEACQVVVSLVGNLAGADVEKACLYEPHPRCGVIIKRKSA